jgi:hypothetical protein
MKATQTMVAVAWLAAVAPSMAGTVELHFGDAPLAPAKAQDFYAASLPGVAFSADAWVAKSRLVGGYGNFYQEPDADRGALTLTSKPDRAPGETSPPLATSFTISLKNAFFNDFSMHFTGEGSISVTAFDANGAALGGSSGSAPIPEEEECVVGFFCKWAPITIDLADGLLASSITVSGADRKFWFDDMVFTLADAPGPGPGTVPEPGGVALSLAALGVLAWSRRRSR